MLLLTLQNLSVINTILIALVTYFMIGFIIYSIKKSDIKLLNAVADSVKKGPRGRKHLLEEQSRYEVELMSSFLWPKILWRKFQPVLLARLKNTRVVLKLRQLKNAKSKKEK